MLENVLQPPFHGCMAIHAGIISFKQQGVRWSMAETRRQQKEQQALKDAVHALQSRTWMSDDLITVEDAILFIASRVNPHWRETMGETLKRIRQMFSIGQTPKRRAIALKPDGDGCLTFGELMRWVYSTKNLRSVTSGDGVSVFDGLPGFENMATVQVTLGGAQSSGYAYAMPSMPADPAEYHRVLQDALVQLKATLEQNIELKKEVARLQTENDVMRPTWLKAEARRKINRQSATAPRPRKKKET